MKSPCLEHDALFHLSLGYLTEETAVSARAHLMGCATCQAVLQTVEGLSRAIASPVEPSKLAPADVAARAMQAPLTVERSRYRWPLAVAAGLALCMAAGLAMRVEPTDRVTPRGGAKSWAERVTAKIVTSDGHFIETGARVRADVLLTASVRGLAPEDSLHLLAFIVDSNHQIHWIAPSWADSNQAPPTAQAISPNAGADVILPTVVRFDDLAKGGALAVTALATRVASVLDVEQLPVADEVSLRAL